MITWSQQQLLKGDVFNQGNFEISAKTYQYSNGWQIHNLENNITSVS